MRVSRRTPLIFVSLALSLAACGGGGPPPGTPVGSLADSGAGSLREAIASASAGATLRLTQSGTLSLNSPLSIDKNLTIIATGVTLDAAGKGRALEVGSGANVTVLGGTFKGGVGQVLPAGLNAARLGERFGPPRMADPAAPKLSAASLRAQAAAPTAGGVLLNSGTLTLDGVTVTGGKANLGGGIYNAAGATLTLKGTTSVTGNTAELVDPADTTIDQGIGGGVFNKGTLTVSGGSVSGNTAVYAGGGIYGSALGSITLSAGAVDTNTVTAPLTVSNSVAGGSAGGGILTNGSLLISGGSVSGNTAAYFGAGVTAQATVDPQGTVTIPTVTLSGGSFENNRVTDDAGGGSGGAFWISGTLTMTGGTVKGNSAPYGGGIAVFRDASITGGTIEGNEARTKHGGGLLVYTPPARTVISSVTLGGTATVRGNRAAEHSGGILVDRTTFTMTGGIVQGNTAVNSGGGLAFGGGTSSAIQGGVISGNRLTGTVDGGGGVRVFSSSALTLAGGEIRDNTAVKTGGGITVGGSVTMTGGRITGNRATNRTSGADTGGGGGGVRLYAGASMTASGGTISGNSAWYGGGIETNGAFQASPTSTFVLSGATLSGNRAEGLDGGGVWNDGSLTIQSGSVTGNSARNGGGVFNTRVGAYAQPGGSLTGNTPDNVFSDP
ncbi:beta strand repeat-containing protein [Deinococcus koreensis]|uniref:Right handed beta helix domain-containing protein n=1 Tax=Deinococcus koreensis TaxID=2054903 RepID=A0A2K3UVT7_9DEIO|nr:hypothetical protein [Deinococcus koreensis]PNY80653.1 hypothetical protein CVO96_04105 [Deinococcus koreensis]